MLLFEPRQGNVAELGFGYASGSKAVTVRIVAKARTNGDFGVTTFVGQIPAALQVRSQQITLWGVPWDAINDVWRAKLGHYETSSCRATPGLVGDFGEYISAAGAPGPCQASYDPSWGPIKPFLTTETDCNPAPITTAWVDVYQKPGAFSAEGDPILTGANPLDEPWKIATSQSPSVTGCASLPFAPNIEFTPTTSAADSASGLDVDLSISQNNDAKTAQGDLLDPPGIGASQSEVSAYVEDATEYFESDAGLATAHLDKVVVTLSEGFSVNPSAATGLEACSDAELGGRTQGNPPLFNNEDPFDGRGGAEGAECPGSSRIGTVEVWTLLLEEVVDGDLVFGCSKSTDPQG
jgi:hypothetical protein